jgi:hypothetical protein
VRAGFERASVESFARNPGLEAHVRDSVGPELLDYVTSARGMAWLDGRRTSAIRAAQVGYCGWEKTREHYTELMLEFTAGPLMNTIAQAMIRVFGVHADKTHRVYPHLWSAFTRDLGRVQGELVRDNLCRIYFEDAPVDALDYELVLVMHEAALHAMFQFAKIPARITREGSRERAQFEIRW